MTKWSKCLALCWDCLLGEKKLDKSTSRSLNFFPSPLLHLDRDRESLRSAQVPLGKQTDQETRNSADEVSTSKISFLHMATHSQDWAAKKTSWRGLQLQGAFSIPVPIANDLFIKAHGG